ncbi:MAG TPA: adenylate/guanylate cyclase domain-containing protein [bacterium]|nr:adenylate/guanylate cyclase domain-containing protein [bacterium]
MIDLKKNLQRQIRRDRKEITILFTDIESSAQYWEKKGDITGRLMMDVHNRLVFPVIKHYRGRIVKTIGDSLMVAFREPSNAVKAAVAIQQILDRERQADPEFPCIRIGMHTGHAIVEKRDVFGDTVNTASRIQSRAGVNEIWLSAKTAWRLSRKMYLLQSRGRFKPRGKRKEMTIYRCQWKKLPSMIPTIRHGADLILDSTQRRTLLVCSAVIVFFIGFLFIRYIRFFAADSKMLSLLMLDPVKSVIRAPWLAVVPVLFLVPIVLVILKVRRFSLKNIRLIHGGVGFCIGYTVSILLLTWILGKNDFLNRVVFESRHLIVEVVESQAGIHKFPDPDSPVLRTLPRGSVLLLADVKKIESMIWNKVLIGQDTYGWVVRVVPARLGVPEKRITLTRKHYFKFRDLISMAAGFLTFLVFYVTFRLRPA